ncbi:hypothetical protein [Streptomyces sp. 35G-GA-8]|uniref:hypothetical protein n=1 Tax=Streptomyces sp. 35G-GA-8 TaxID=2939434 RepID=UPI00201EA9EF|nr:hypothetical protein [Streptomyces sp. 35G-GA-8]MCL7382191.1 hypothetical protein [Streptomyces sp. 35G-GA-8]
MRATIMTRPVPVVTTPTEPRPRGDRPVGFPLTPTHTGLLATVFGTGRTARAATVEEIQREEDTSGRDGNGYEDEPEAALGTPLLANPDRPPLPQREPGKTLTPDDDFHQLVRHLVADGDQRAVRLGGRARRTLDQMSPGTTVQPLLVLTGSAAVR